MADEEEGFENEQPIINIGNYTGGYNTIGEREGEGRAEFANKDVYKGEFQAGKRNGKGAYRWAYLGMKYVGQYRDGLRNGSGTMYYTNGTVYDGQWKDGYRHGEGRIEYPNYDIYEGQWVKGLPQGTGKYYYASTDSMVEGEFMFGRVVSGKLVLRDGTYWEGQFRLNEPFGKGTWYTAEGWKQTGEFIEMNPVKPEEGEEELEEKAEEGENGEGGEEVEKAEQEAQEPQDQDQPAEGGEEGQEGEGKEKPDPKEKLLRELLPPRKVRKTLPYELPEKKQERLEVMKTLKLRWIPDSLPVRYQ